MSFIIGLFSWLFGKKSQDKSNVNALLQCVNAVNDCEEKDRPSARLLLLKQYCEEEYDYKAIFRHMRGLCPPQELSEMAKLIWGTCPSDKALWLYDYIMEQEKENKIKKEEQIQKEKIIMRGLVEKTDGEL